MDLQSLVSSLRQGMQDVPDATPDDDLQTQAARTALRAGVVDALRKTVTNPQGTGSWHGNFFIPNFAGFGQQVGAGLALPGQEATLLQAQQADRMNQLAAAKAALAQQPEHPGDQSAGPPIPGQLQDQMQGNFAAGLMQNPMTAKTGAALLNKALAGGFAEEEQTRAEKMADKAAERDFRLQMLKQTGEQNRLLQELRGGQKIKELEAKATLNPKGLSNKDYVKLSGDLGNRLSKEGKEYGEMVDAIDRVQSLVGDSIKNKTPLTASQADALIYAYNKVLDPHSVVREGEYARTTGQNPVMDKVGLWLNQVKDGKVVATPELSQQMLETLNNYSKPSRDKLYALSDNYATQAKQAGINPNFVVTKESWRNPANLGAYAEAEADQAKPTSSGGETSVAPNLKPMPTSFKDSQWDDLESKVSPQYADKLKGIRLHGERSNSDQVSSADARTPYQITQKTRDLIRNKYGFDPWDGPENAIRGAEIVLKDGLQKYGGDTRKALDHYSGNTPGYADRVLKNTAAAQAKKVEPTKSVLSSSGWSIQVE